jgi:hypothetical protein
MSELKVEKINLGTSLSSENPNAAIHITRDNNTSTIVLEENINDTGAGDIRFWKTTGGAATSDGDNIGLILFYSDKGETQVAAIVVDVSDGGSGSARIKLRTKESGDSSPSTRMTIDSAGLVAIGTTSGSAKKLLVVSNHAGTGASAYTARFTSTQSSSSTRRNVLGLNFDAANADSNSDYFARMHTDDTSDLEYYIRGDGVTSQTFTGQHWVIFVADSNSVNAEGNMSDELVPGMIIESTGEIWIRKDIETTIPKVSKCSIVNSKKVFGVMSGDYASGLDMSYWNHNSNTMNTASAVPEESEVEDKGTYSSDSTEFKCRVNSIGEGSVWVTNVNGNIENGDYITSSTVSGYGQLQDDDLLHNYTVAKCTETIDWDSATDTIEHSGQTYKKYLTGCTYHCG